jgi:hypothetical protein
LGDRRGNVAAEERRRKPFHEKGLKKQQEEEKKLVAELVGLLLGVPRAGFPNKLRFGPCCF